MSEGHVAEGSTAKEFIPSPLLPLSPASPPLYLLFLLLLLLAGLQAGAQEPQIQQVGPHNTTTVRAVGKPGRYIGFDVLADDKLVAPVRFTSLELITCPKAVAVSQGDTSTLTFDNLTAAPESGLELTASRIVVRLDSQKFPVVQFDWKIKAFDPSKWQQALGKQPFHFLTLAMPAATVWHHRGWLNATPLADPFPLLGDVHTGTPELSAYPYNRQWSTTPPLAAHPLPVIGLWSPARRLYAAWDFQATRLTDNSERDIATGFCNRLILPVKKVQAGTEPPNRDPARAYALAKAEKDTDRDGKSKFVALVSPYGGTGYQQLIYPQGGEHLASRAALVYHTDLGDTDDPNRFLWQSWWSDPNIRSRLPHVPAGVDLSWIPGGCRLTSIPGAPRGSLLAGVEGKFQVPGTELISGWRRHNESVVDAPYKRGDRTRMAQLERDAAILIPYAKRFKAGGEECVYWEKPLVGRWTDEWGGAGVTTLHNANGWAAGRLLLDLYRCAGKKAYLPLVDGVFHWAKHVVWTRNEFADVPSSPFAIGGTLATSFLLDYYFTFKNDAERRSNALAALDLAHSLTYRYMAMWGSDNNRGDNLDSAFLWEPNSGRDWTGAACSNEVAWNLDTLAQTAVHTGDPVLMWALQGTLSRWHLLYQEVYRGSLKEYGSTDFTEGYALAPGTVYGAPGSRAAFGFGDPLDLLEPVGSTTVRVLAGEKAALAFCKNGEVTRISKYRCTAPGDFAFMAQRPSGDKAAFAATITFPYADLSEKPVYIVRDGVIKIRLKEGEQIQRNPNALWTLIVTGLHDRDTVVIGNPDLAGADNLPTLPPLTEPAAAIPAAQTAPFECLASGQAILPNADWNDLNAFAGLPGGLRWIDGIPFQIGAEWRGKKRTGLMTLLLRPIAANRTVLLLYTARSDEAGDPAPPELLLDDDTPAPLLREKSALGWRAWPPIYKQRALIAVYRVPEGRQAVAMREEPVQYHADILSGQKDSSTSGGNRSILAVTLLSDGPQTESLLTQLGLNLEKGETEWQRLQQADSLSQEMQKLALHLPVNAVAVLPPDNGQSPANRLLGSGRFRTRMTTLTPSQMIDPAQFNAGRFPVALYVGGEEYPNHVASPGDGAEALLRYVHEGGTLILLASQPHPLYYGIGQNGQTSPNPLLAQMGLPLQNVIETAPDDKLRVEQVSGQKALLEVPNTFPYPSGDPRLRSVDTAKLSPNVIYTPIYRVRGKLDTDYGDAAALIELPPTPDGRRGRILYLSNVLLRDSDNGPRLVRAVLRWLVNAVNPSP